LIGEEHERSVVLHLETSTGDAPLISSLEAVPLSPGSYAPATFRVVSKVKNAAVCVWDLDEAEKPLEVVTDPSNNLDHLVTFKQAGGYVIKLVAVNGTKSTQRSEIVNVLEPPGGTITATVSVTDDATRVKTEMSSYIFTQNFPADCKDNVARIDRQVPARHG